MQARERNYLTVIAILIGLFIICLGTHARDLAAIKPQYIKLDTQSPPRQIVSRCALRLEFQRMR